MSLPIFPTVLKGISVIGSIVGTRQDLVEVFDLHAHGRTKVVAETRKLDDVNTAIDEVLNGRPLRGWSSSSEPDPMPEITRLSVEECERLLRAGTFGRVAFSTERRPEILPVNYAVEDGAVWIRTEPGGLLARSAPGLPLAFEVDLVDHERWHGWSVVAHGTGELVAEAEAREHFADRPPVRPGRQATAARSSGSDGVSCRAARSAVVDTYGAMPVRQLWC